MFDTCIIFLRLFPVKSFLITFHIPVSIYDKCNFCIDTSISFLYNFYIRNLPKTHAASRRPAPKQDKEGTNEIWFYRNYTPP